MRLFYRIRPEEPIGAKAVGETKVASTPAEKLVLCKIDNQLSLEPAMAKQVPHRYSEQQGKLDALNKSLESKPANKNNDENGL